MSDLFRLKLVSKRQVTIPQRVMDLLRLELGDEIHLKIANGKIVQAFPVHIPANLDMSEDAQRRFEEIEKETAASGAADTDWSGLMDQYSNPEPAHKTGEFFSSNASALAFLNSLLGQGGWPVACRVAPRNFERSDERITEIAAEALANAPIDVSTIDVSVDKGEVILEGTMNDGTAKVIAELVVRNILGVKDVHNKIEVASPARASQQLAAEFERVRTAG